MIKNVVPLGEAVVKHEFVYEKNGVTTFECRELISREANGAQNICVFKAVFGPREEHAKHKHTACDEIVFCVRAAASRGSNEFWQVRRVRVRARNDFAFAAHVGHYTRTPTISRISISLASSSACPTWTRRRRATCRLARSPT